MNAIWSVRIERMEVHLPVGIYAHEMLPQPLWVSLKASAAAPASPDSLGQCFDYEPLCQWLEQVWPATPHTPLLETRMNQLIAQLFSLDQRVSEVWVGLYKQRMGRNAQAVGMERATTRTEFEAQQRHDESNRADGAADTFPPFLLHHDGEQLANIPS